MAGEEMKVKNEYHKGFAAGIVYALGRLVEIYDQPTIANDILKESGVDVRHASEYDVAFLRKENPKLRRGKD